MRNLSDGILVDGMCGTSSLPIELFETLTCRPSWHAQAACLGKGTDLWFPERGEDLEPARAICAGCPVQAECAEAGRREKFGVWAGVSYRGRRLAKRAAA